MNEISAFFRAVLSAVQNTVVANPTTVAVVCAVAAVVAAVSLGYAVKCAAAKTRTKGMLTRFTEALRCQPDGFYVWLYDDIGFLSQTMCSPRLAVMMNLFDGMETEFSVILERLTPKDTEKLTAALKVMRTEQTPFSLNVTSPDETKRWKVSGFQAQSAKHLPLIDIVWFRDITETTAEITALSESVLTLRERETMFNTVFNAFPFPVWLRNEDLQIVLCNPAYLQASSTETEAEPTVPAELIYEKSPREARVLAAAARASGREHTAREYVMLNGRRRLADVSEIPLKNSDVPRGRTLGFLRDVTTYRDMEENLKNHITAHNGVLEHLKTAIAVFAPDTRLTFYNTSFLNLWDLDEQWLDSSPTYAHFIDTLRDRRKLPEHRDFNAYKKKELHYFSTLVSMQEDTMHLPNGLTLRRTMTPHPLGGLLIVYEDVTDHLAMERSMNVLNDTQRALIDKMQEAVLVFSNTSRVRFVNSAYAALWNVDVAAIEAEAPTIPEMLEKQRPFFDAATTDWTALKEQLLGALSTPTGETFQLMRPDGVVLEFAVSALPDGGVLVSYLDITQSEKYAASLKKTNAALMRKTREDSENSRRQQAFFKRFITQISPLLETLDTLAHTNALEPAALSKTICTLKNKITETTDLCLLQSASPVLELDSLDLPTFVDEIAAALSFRLPEKELTLEKTCSADIGFCITDKERLRPVLSYLLNTMASRAANRTKIFFKTEKDTQKGVVFTLSFQKAPNASFLADDTLERRLLTDCLTKQNALIAFSADHETETVRILLPRLE